MYTLACDISLEASALCTITWSEHQYQIEDIASPKVNPDQGKSDSPKKFWKKLHHLCLFYVYHLKS